MIDKHDTTTLDLFSKLPQVPKRRAQAIKRAMAQRVSQPARMVARKVSQ